MKCITSKVVQKNECVNPTEAEYEGEKHSVSKQLEAQNEGAKYFQICEDLQQVETH